MPLFENNSLRSDQLGDFISHEPGVLVRFGLPIISVLIIALIITSNYIEYPHIVRAYAKMNSINPPKAIHAKVGGRVIKLLLTENTKVRQGDIIAYIESTGSHSDILRLADILDTLQTMTDSNRFEDIYKFWESSKQLFINLGELQQAHQTFIQGFLSFKDYLSKGYYSVKKQMLNKDLNNAQRLSAILEEQKKIQEEDLSLAIKDFNVHDTLHKEAILTDLDFRSQKRQLLSKRIVIPQAKAVLLNNLTQQQAIRKELLELDNQIQQQKLLFLQILNTFRSAVQEWILKYVIIAPQEGKLEYATFVQENQLLQPGQLIGYVTNKSGDYYAEMWIPQPNSGKVKAGQQVLLKFASYASQEFGSVKGRIDLIKSVPSDSGYLAKVSLPYGLMTNYNKKIVFREGMTATAEIITEKQSLFHRVFGQIYSRF